jgi:Domain of unknown function (DUF4382)/Carboxypeptidase regulatory-like domain
VLAANDSNDPLANSVVPSGGSETALTTPSGQQSGVKANIDIDIAADQMADFVVDFDACRSVVRAGNSGKYLLKPVITVVPNYVSGVLGYLDPALVGVPTSVSLEQSGAIVKTTVPDGSGKFLLEPVAPGTYDLVVVAEGHATAVVTGVVVAADLVTSINSSASGLSPPTWAPATAAGTVTTESTPIDATVDALQTLTGGDTIDVAGMPVDAISGSYALELPVDATEVAAYVPSPAELVFVPDNATAGRYTLAATSGGVTKTAGPLTLVPNTTTTTNFSFP